MKLRPNCKTFIFTAPSFVAAGTVSSGANSATPALPAGATTDDILIYMVSWGDGGGNTSTEPAGYTRFILKNGTQTRMAVYWKRHSGSESAQTFAPTTAGHGVIARMLAFRGCIASGSPVDQAVSSADETNQTALSTVTITTLIPNSMIVNMVGMLILVPATTTTEFSGWTNANLTSITEATDNTTNNGDGPGLGSAYGLKATSGSVGSTTLTGVNNVHHLYMTFNLIGLRT